MPGQSETRPVYSAALRRYLALVVCTSVPVAIGAVLGLVASPPTGSVLLGALTFALAAIVAELNPVPLDEKATRSVSLAFVFLLAEQVLFGWPYAVLAAVAAMALSQAVERIEPRRALFNTSVYALSVFASAIPALVFGLDGRALDASSFGLLTTLVFVGGAIFVLTNVLLIAVAVALAQGVRITSMLEDYVRHAGPAFVIMAFISALATSLWKTAPLLEVLLAGPLFALALYQRYAYRSVLAQRDAETDALTLLGNHRAFHADLGDALAPDAPPLALVVLDIDNFKGINDSFGHPVGDEVLKALAETMRSVLDEQRCYRVGGEEFAVLLIGHDEYSARAALDVLHARLAETPAPHGRGITVSIGLAFSTAARDRDELLRIADSALYWAKNHGKGRTCVFAPGMIRTHSRAEVAEQAERAARLRAAESLIRVVDAKDTYTGQHSQSVSRLSLAIARELRLDDETCEQLRLAALLHDVGKIAIPDAVLQKPGRLEPEELRLLKEHPEIGARLLEGAGVEPIDLWIRHHHEAWDGSGYPNGLREEEIPLGSRIILVADAFDAMTTDRVYRAGRPHREAFDELRRCSWQQFDARIVAALERAVDAERSDSMQAEAS